MSVSLLGRSADVELDDGCLLGDREGPIKTCELIAKYKMCTYNPIYAQLGDGIIVMKSWTKIHAKSFSSIAV